MNYFDMDVPWLEHFVDHKLLIEAMTPNRSLCPRRCVQTECLSKPITGIACADVG